MLTARPEFEDGPPPGETEDVIAALLEAGAAEIAFSPRRLQHILVLAGTHAINVRNLSGQLDEAPSIADWARSRLPWQMDRNRS
jgi:hypothetical protein